MERKASEQHGGGRLPEQLEAPVCGPACPAAANTQDRKCCSAEASHCWLKPILNQRLAAQPRIAAVAVLRSAATEEGG